MTAPVMTTPLEQLVILELPVATYCPHGVVTLRALAPGFGAVLERLEYGAGKHPGEQWRRQSVDEHLAALARHTLALGEIRHDAARGLVDAAAARAQCRTHLAAIASRAAMALAVDTDRSEER